MRIASFDIGKKNFAFCIEEFDETQLLSLDCLPTPKNFTPEYTQLLLDIYKNGNVILLDNVDVSGGSVQGKYLDPIVYHNINQVLDSYKDLWDTCSIFIIEQQMSFKQKRNVMAIKLGQHVYSYFTFQYADFKTLVEFPSYHKTKVLSDAHLSDYKRKRWAVDEALKLLEIRKDTAHRDLIKSRKKKDDLSDVIVQIQAYKYLYLKQKK